ncbi:MAG: hypothetical protein JXR39_06795 [Marinilabiliaceae bacterium]|nr:hypothetical protein [Marinilabiliaceae bacterium]
MKRIYTLPLLLMLVTQMPSQSKSTESSLLQNIKTHQTWHRQEKCFIHTDRPIYTGGETCWFSVWLMDASTHRLNHSERVAYVELADAHETPLIRQMIRMEKGIGQGSMLIPENLTAGTYTIRGYTNWMRNAGSDFFFRNTLAIVRPDTTNAPSQKTEAAPPLPDTSPQASTAADTTLMVRFFPEGGEIIEGVPCKVAYEAVSASGVPQMFTGIVTNKGGQMVASVTPIWAGRGFFTLTPEKGETYTLTLPRPEGTPRTFLIPPARPSGTGLWVEHSRTSPDLIVSVLSTVTASTDTLYLLTLQNGRPVTAQPLVMSNGIQSFRIDKTLFEGGMVQLTLFDRLKRPVNERLVFIHQPSLRVSIHETDIPGHPRARARYRLEALYPDGRPAQGTFSVSVTDAQRIPEGAYTDCNMVNTLQLTSNMPGLIQQPNQFFANTHKSFLQTELLMLTNGWRRYEWHHVMTDTVRLPRFLEEPGLYVTGKLTRNHGPAPEGIDITMLVSGKMSYFNQKSDKTGRFTFLLNDFNDTMRAVVQTKNKLNNVADYNLEVHTNFRSHPEDSPRHRPLIWQHTPPPSPITPSQLAMELTQRMSPEMFVDTTDVSLNEVTVSAQNLKNVRGVMTQQFGPAQESVGQKQIADLNGSRPWNSGLISLLNDAFPGMEIDLMDADLTSIRFRVKNKIQHRIFIYVDGQMAGASDDQGRLTHLLNQYGLEELISMDAAVVESVDLIFPPVDKQGVQLHVLTDPANRAIAMPRGEATPTNDPSSDAKVNFEANMNLFPKNHTSPIAVVAIYTKDGGGIRTRARYKGIRHITLQGFSGTQTFYHPVYNGTAPSRILKDERNTLAWWPRVQTDSLGQADLIFYNSDVARQFRFEVNGLSTQGEAGALRWITDELSIDTPQTGAERNERRTDTEVQ